MKKLMIAVIAGTLSFPAFAFQGQVLGPPQFAADRKGTVMRSHAAERARW